MEAQTRRALRQASRHYTVSRERRKENNYPPKYEPIPTSAPFGETDPGALAFGFDTAKFLPAVGGIGLPFDSPTAALPTSHFQHYYPGEHPIHNGKPAKWQSPRGELWLARAKDERLRPELFLPFVEHYGMEAVPWEDVEHRMPDESARADPTKGGGHQQYPWTTVYRQVPIIASDDQHSPLWDKIALTRQDIKKIPITLDSHYVDLATGLLIAHNAPRLRISNISADTRPVYVFGRVGKGQPARCYVMKGPVANRFSKYLRSTGFKRVMLGHLDLLAMDAAMYRVLHWDLAYLGHGLKMLLKWPEDADAERPQGAWPALPLSGPDDDDDDDNESAVQDEPEVERTAMPDLSDSSISDDECLLSSDTPQLDPSPFWDPDFEDDEEDVYVEEEYEDDYGLDGLSPGAEHVESDEWKEEEERRRIAGQEAVDDDLRYEADFARRQGEAIRQRNKIRAARRLKREADLLETVTHLQTKLHRLSGGFEDVFPTEPAVGWRYGPLPLEQKERLGVLKGLVDKMRTEEARVKQLWDTASGR